MSLSSHEFLFRCSSFIDMSVTIKANIFTFIQSNLYLKECFNTTVVNWNYLISSTFRFLFKYFAYFFTLDIEHYDVYFFSIISKKHRTSFPTADMCSNHNHTAFSIDDLKESFIIIKLKFESILHTTFKRDLVNQGLTEYEIVHIQLIN